MYRGVKDRILADSYLAYFWEINLTSKRKGKLITIVYPRKLHVVVHATLHLFITIHNSLRVSPEICS